MSEEVLTSEEDGILVVTINRPDAKNAMTKAAAEGIAAAMDRLDSDDNLRVGILTGAGGTFCSGMDLKGFLRGESPSVEGRGFGGVVQQPPEKPLIAAVEGYALAGGLELMIACDLVVASAAAKFGIPEVKRGLVAAAGGVMMLPDQIPERIAMELALTGDFIDAPRAYELGLINRVTDGDALAGAKELAARIVANGPLAVKVSKQVIKQSRGWPMDERYKRQTQLIAPVFVSEDAREGAAAFAEKRAPNWKGK
ncbi:MAG TPA: enoyl-CoA hydratase [Erythrobacter sp.]|jgi:enoyl-CoA hydratase|uniref:Enoyl-CoA hydratase n=3 Tax=Erythrobacteraceae TaxID=335929 RepID=A0A6I4U8E3_9SPHN|nr:MULTISPECIES: crotonase/enoyl-CoA hydratase family protein [Erythrobacteraceae]MAL54918.1 enoyl-CoA hydratase [Sphingomonadaceae bacterium]MBN90700.1 enoyl-CoA hydratase [Erythrobacteraceae bacterium]MCZ4265037.1 crotonase/enoyl-CoA hydratase family protein [Erythrobacter sp. G21629-S1]RZP18940.1 MAG: crotonase/enoyl-CoA hydratase family protein [Erythrobacter sp.]KNH02274.1 enoyl- hydratase [Qipengyuania citrea LAMA 915]|tara:strand:- start:790 stop:1551 length:762 start_codon:yes stop_codon:yes gene_type:complete